MKEKPVILSNKNLKSSFFLKSEMSFIRRCQNKVILGDLIWHNYCGTSCFIFHKADNNRIVFLNKTKDQLWQTSNIFTCLHRFSWSYSFFRSIWLPTTKESFPLHQMMTVLPVIQTTPWRWSETGNRDHCSLMRRF